MKIILSSLILSLLLPLTAAANQSDSLAYGVRAKFGLFKVYGVNIYTNNINKICTAMAAQADKEALLNDQVFLQNMRAADLVAQLDFMRTVDAETIAEAIIKALDSRLNSTDKESIMNDFLAIFASLEKIRDGDSIVFAAEDDALIITSDALNIQQTIQSRELVQAFFSIYTDEKAVINGLTKQIIANVNCPV